MFNRIVVGIDGSETSEKALKVACNLAKMYDSEIYIVHSPQPQTVAFALGAAAGYHALTTMPSSEEINEASDNIVSTADAIVKNYDLGIAQAHVEQGDPAEIITTCAEECGADLIVTGRRGLGCVGALVQGSITQRVGHLAQCACLSVV